MKQHSNFLIICMLLFFTAGLSAKVKLPVIFGNNMVLQQQSDVPLWGEASPNKTLKIKTSWDDKITETLTDSSGKWKVFVKTPVYGGPYSIEFNDGQKLKIENVMIGEVWLCSGQSNMEMGLAGWGKINDYEKEIAAANYPNIRLLHVVQNTGTKPLNDISVKMGGWVNCSPETVAEFSAVGYFFGRNIIENTQIPIGLINSSWGGTIAEAWVSGSSLKAMPDFNAAVTTMEESNNEVVDLKQTYEEELAQWTKQVIEKDNGYKNGKPLFSEKNLDTSGWKSMHIPSAWENGPLASFDGTVWFRKEVDIPAEWGNRKLTLTLDVIDDNDICFFNGVEIGRTEGWNVERKYTIPANIVKAGKAVIAVRVFDAVNGGGIYGNPDKISISSASGKSISLVGEWLYKVGVSLADLPRAPRNWNEPNRATVLFNAMINPIVPYTIKGVLWYQGESNAHRAYQYRELLPLLVKDWRKQWNCNFPFYFVQLANFTAVLDKPAESEWAELREAQTKTLCLEKTGMAVTIDIGDAKDIHPKNKQEVGRRLALIARAKDYGEKIHYSGPLFDSYVIEGNTIRIRFKETADGLLTPNGEVIKGFSIAGLDHTFHWANARIEENTVVVWCDNVINPIAVRYAWATNPVCNLFNSAGLPASPFRTDDWPGVTMNRK